MTCKPITLHSKELIKDYTKGPDINYYPGGLGYIFQKGKKFMNTPKVYKNFVNPPNSWKKFYDRQNKKNLKYISPTKITLTNIFICNFSQRRIST